MAGLARVIYTLEGRVRPLWAVLGCGNRADSHKVTKRRHGPANGLYGGLLSLPLSPPLLNESEKIPPAGHRRPYKRRKMCEGLGGANALEGVEGMKNPHQR